MAPRVEPVISGVAPGCFPLMVGYAENHSADTYRMYDPNTNGIKSTRDVRWANWNRIKPEEDMDLFEDNKIKEKKDDMENDSPDDMEDEIETEKEITPERLTTDDLKLGRNEEGEGADEIVSEKDKDGHPSEEDEVSDKSVKTQRRANKRIPMEVRKLHT